MKLSELITSFKPFEAVFHVKHPTEFAVIFGDITPVEVDGYTLLAYGERTVTPTLMADNVGAYVSAVIALNLSQWMKTAEALKLQYDTLAPTAQEKTTSETATTTDNNTGSETGSEKAFNDTVFSDSEKSSATDQKQREETRQYTETTKGSRYTPVQLIEQELSLRSVDSAAAQVVRELIQAITIDIY